MREPMTHQVRGKNMIFLQNDTIFARFFQKRKLYFVILAHLSIFAVETKTKTLYR